MLANGSRDDIMASMRELVVPSSAEDSLTSQSESIASEWMFFRTEPSKVSSTWVGGCGLIIKNLFFVVVTVDDIKMAELDSRGVSTTANGHQVALFYCNDTIHCVDEKCPHAGNVYNYTY